MWQQIISHLPLQHLVLGTVRERRQAWALLQSDSSYVPLLHWFTLKIKLHQHRADTNTKYLTSPLNTNVPSPRGSHTLLTD